MTTIASVRTRPAAGLLVEDRLRRGICLATILACLPYTFLKVAWVLGWGVGSTDDAFTGHALGANAVTGFLDLAAIAVAILLVLRLGQRIPAFLIAFPLWIAAGLLVPVASGFVFGSILQLATGGGSPAQDDSGLQAWVFLVIYGGFVLQAVLLGAGLVRYVRERWPGLLAGGHAHDGAGQTRSLQNVLGWIFIPAGLGYAFLCIRWAVSGGGRFPDPSTGQGVLLVVSGVLAVGAVIAYAALVRGRRLHLRWLIGGFVGTAVAFTDALSCLINVLLFGPGDWGHAGFTAGESVGLLFIAFCALGGAIGGALRLLEEQRPAGGGAAAR